MSTSRRGDGPPRSIVSPDFPSEFKVFLFDKPLEAEAVALLEVETDKPESAIASCERCPFVGKEGLDLPKCFPGMLVTI